MPPFSFTEHVYLMIILFMGRSDHERNKAEEMKAAALELSHAIIAKHTSGLYKLANISRGQWGNAHCTIAEA